MSAMRRLAFVAFTALGLASAIWFGGPQNPAQRAAAGLLGERWYQVALHGRPIGRYRSQGVKTARAYRFETDLAFRIAAQGETRIVDRLVFAASPPHLLLEASHVIDNGGDVTQLVIRRAGGALEARLNARSVPLDWDYALSDYVALETWLATPRHPGEQRISRSVDFDGLGLASDHWRVISAADGRYALRRHTPLGAAKVQLDTNFVPERFEIGQLFALSRVRGPEYLAAWRSGALAFPIGLPVPLDKPLADGRALRRLVLRVHAEGDEDAAAWPALRRNPSGSLLLERSTAQRQRVSAAQAQTLASETVAYPANRADIRQLARQAAGEATRPRDQLEALVRFVNAHLEYAETGVLQSVAETLRSRRGDCTAYADLLTTLARSLGLPARTVTGLAYADSAFATHNWTEVAIDGWWHGVDPTWGRTQLDAAHIPLPQDGELAVLGLLPGLRFELLQAEYEEA